MSRRRALTAALCMTSFVLLSACGTAGAGSGASGEIHGGMDMSPGMHMGAHHSPATAPSSDTSTTAGRPSESARMVCSDEIHTAVARTFEQPALATGTSTWAGELFTCTYALESGDLVLSVKDSPTGVSGRAYFDATRDADERPPLLKGLAAFGLPSYETDAGRVVFLKDGKTLVVDAGALPEVAGPEGQSRSEAAYAIAADVIGCWSE